MKFFINIFFGFLILATLLSCGGTTHNLSSGNFSKTHSYKINSYYGCCGCKAKYFTINSGKRKVEQVIYSYNCYGTGKPTKFVFNYNNKGRLMSCDKYIATVQDDFSLKLTDQEKMIFETLDASNVMKADYSTVRLSDIKGFRKPQDKEITHTFPLIKKGYKLPVQ
jgi:hypothetical protein